ncbi:allophycocyanin beta-18 subunit apoprotein [Thalassoporum mexicanum PCC 7367]|uniref:allophycocyanin subunit beta n=1 Tax=Thalassoporum mexicanum TaxID=3457544 RepID=UPI00029FC074|nr:allophycocyanin subunit beta [Pseudanabaena sp. PCC 7367]AFY69771.1 allophycocyanin beta-18 subunit apoprotein [Pseudanabaena sp. PCC 7367]
MLDAVTSLIGAYDATGRYLDRDAYDQIKSYFDTGAERLKAASMITGNAAAIVQETGLTLFDAAPTLIRPGGNAYTTRRYAACLRDVDYFLRYATYALVAGDNFVLDERVLQGLRETYNSLGVPIGSVAQSIQIMKAVVVQLVGTDASWLTGPFDYMANELSEVNI